MTLALSSFAGKGVVPLENRAKWIDVTVAVTNDTPVWPGDPAPVITAVARHEDGDELHLSEVFFNLHTGTHIDAPLHFIPGGSGVEAISFDSLLGTVRVIDASVCACITAQWLNGRIHGNDRVILKTLADHADRRVLLEKPDFSALDVSAARMIVESGIVLVGIDGLSIAIQSQLAQVHHILLEKGVVILEHLDLRGVEEGLYEMIALPLRIPGAEAAPTRVLLRPVPQT